jgi:mannose-6-phosphate isomerase-like protein (cupin superfamily)
MNKPETKSVPQKCDVIAPDGSEIRLLPILKSGSSVHCTLPAGGISQAIRHKTVEEIWYVLAGEGEIWRKDQDGVETVVKMKKGVSLTIPLGTSFQFRALEDHPLEIFIVTMPPWPNNEEAIVVPNHWTKG